MPRKQTSSAFPGALNPALESAIEAAYDAAWEYGSQGRPDVGALQVYADWLQEEAHPLGEQLALELSDDETWKKQSKKKGERADAIAAGRKANPELYGGGLPIGEDHKDPVLVRWDRGFIEAIEIRSSNKKVIAACLEGLSRLPTARFVRIIEVSDAAAVDVAQLTAFPALRKVRFWRGAPDLSPLAGARLRALQVPLLDKSAARHVEAMTKLSELTVQDVTLDKPLAAKALRSIRIGDSHHHAKKLKSLEPLTKLAALESLAIEGGSVGSLAPLAKLKSLVYLTVASTKSLTSLAGVDKLAKLTQLDVNLTAVGSLEPLRKCLALQSVNLRGTKVKDLSPLWGLSELERIYAEKTKVKSLAGIEALANLRTLWIHDTGVRDLAPLGELRELETLDIAGLAKVENAQVLAQLPKLRSLDVMAMKPPFDPEVVAQAPALEAVRGAEWPPASRMAGKPLVLAAAAMKKSALPADVRSVRLRRHPNALAVSDDGKRVAVALGTSRDAASATLEVYSTEDGTLVHSIAQREIGPCRGVCFLPDDTLLLVAGEGYHDLWRAELGEEPEKLGRTDAWTIFRDGPGKTVALVQNNERSVAFAPVTTPLKPTWTYRWGDHVPHVLFGAQVRFVGDTARALLSGVHDPVLLDVAKQKVARTIAATKNAYADATRDGKHIAAWFASDYGNPPWLWIYNGDELVEIDDEDFQSTSAHVVFTPDGTHLMRIGSVLWLASLAAGKPVGEPLDNPAARGGQHGPGVLAQRAPLVAWISFNHRDADFRIYWAAFSAR